MRDTVKVAICASHPIQYHVPWYQQLSKCAGIELTVYYITIPDEEEQGRGFGKSFTWDIPMFEGYRWIKFDTCRTRPRLNRFFDTRLEGYMKVLKGAQLDVVIFSGWHTYGLIQTLLACCYLGVPRLVRGESKCSVFRPPYKRMGHRILLSLYTGYLSIGQLNEKFYLDNGAPSGRIFRSPYCVDNTRFSSQCQTLTGSRAHIRAKWHIPSDCFCFLFCGKLQRNKRVFDVFEALERLIKRCQHVHLLVVGGGEQLPAAKGRVNSSRLPVTFAGFLNQTEVANAYVAADCLVLPSDHGETWGLVVNEAMACGLPVIVSDRVGCGPDLVREHQTGLSFPCGDIQALADRMHVIASDRKASKRMGQRAKQHVISGYSVDKAVEGIVKAIRSVAPVDSNTLRLGL